MSMLLWICVMVVMIAVLVMNPLNLYSGHKAIYPKDFIDDLFRKRYFTETNSINQQQQQQRIAIVTGSTSGLGKGISEELYRLGFIVILANRDERKCQIIMKEIMNSSHTAKSIITTTTDTSASSTTAASTATITAPTTATTNNTTGQLICLHLDISDLNSVKQFSMKIIQNYSWIDLMVNNAGIHYGSLGYLLNSKKTPLSPQGFDLSFATNYLGHFLLTELLLPILHDNGRIVNVASTYHFQSDGSFLRPQQTFNTSTTSRTTSLSTTMTMTNNNINNNNNDVNDNNNHSSSSPSSSSSLNRAPIAALGGNHSFWRHRHLAYSNSKLAQILHANELQKRLNSAGRVNPVSTTDIDVNIIHNDNFRSYDSNDNITTTSTNNNNNNNDDDDKAFTSSATTPTTTSTTTTPTTATIAEDRRLIVSVCPGWVGTAMTSFVPHVAQFMYPVNAGILSPMCAILSTSLPTTGTDSASHSQGGQVLVGGEFFTNFRVPGNRIELQQPMARFLTFLSSFQQNNNNKNNNTHNPSSFSSSSSSSSSSFPHYDDWYILSIVRDIIGDFLGQVVLAIQGWDYGHCYVQKASIESYDEVLSADLYDWSKAVLIEMGYLV